MEKIKNLQANIDNKNSEDPTQKLKEQWNKKNNRKTFNLKKVHEEEVKKTIKRINTTTTTTTR